MNDARLGIVRLPLPDGREVALQLTFQRLDAVGPSWFIEKLGVVSKAKAGANTALAELLEAFSDGVVTVDDVQSAPVGTYPLGTIQSAVFQAWAIAQYGPTGRPAEDGDANPRKRPPTWWGSAFARLFGRG